MSASPVLRRFAHLLVLCVILSCDRQSALEPGPDRSTPQRDAVVAVSQILVPDSIYRNTTRFLPLTDIPFGGTVTAVTDGMLAITHPPLTKTDYAVNGSLWSCPPDSETCTPAALISPELIANLVLSRPVTTFGVEIQPLIPGAHDFTATFFLGANPVGSVTRTAILNGYARLLAGSADAVFDRVLISGTGPFAIANIRYQAPNPFIALAPAELQVLFLRPAPGVLASSVSVDMSYTPRFSASGTPKPEPLALTGAVEQLALTGETVTRSLEIGNIGYAMLEYSAASPNPWITLAPADGAVAQGGKVRLDATINSTTLPLGPSSGTVTVSDPNALNTEQTSTVSVTVQHATAMSFGTPYGPYLAQPLGSAMYFIIEAPEGLSDMSVRIRPGLAVSGDADVYVRYGDVPTLTSYDCRPFSSSSNETCLLTLPRAGTYYVMLRAFTAYNDVTLDVVAGGIPIRPVISNVQYISTTRLDLFWTDPSVNEINYRVQRQPVVEGIPGTWETLGLLPANSTYFSDGGVVRGSTYRYRVRPCNAAGCSPWATTLNHTIPGPVIVTSPSALSFLFLRAADGSALANTAPADDAPRARFTATGTVSSFTSATAVANVAMAETASGIFNLSGQYEMIDWTTASTQSWLTVSPDHGTVNAGQTTGIGVTVDASSLPVGVHQANAVITDPNATNSPRAVPIYADVRLVPVLLNGNIVTGLTGTQGSLQYFMVTIPPNALRLTVRVFGETGAANVYVRQGAVPLLNKFDCAAVEICTTNYPPAGVYYVMIHASTAFTGGNLVATLGGAPAPPSALTTTVLTSSSVGLGWADASPNETYFAAQRRTNVADVWSAWSNAGTPGANTTSHTVTGLTAETIHQFRLRSCNVDGCSSWITGSQVTTPAAVPPAAPGPVTATVLSPTQITVGWSDVAFETHYQVQRSTQVDGVFGGYVALGLPTANTTILADVVTGGSTHRYRVRACNAHGCSAYILSPSVTTPANEVPPVPASVSAVAVSPTQIDVSWPDVAGETTYQIYRRERVDGVFGSYTLIGTLPANTTTYNDTGLNAGGTYNHRLRACNAVGCSTFKVGALVTTPGS